MKKVVVLSVSFLLVSFLFTSCFLGGMGEKVDGEGDVRTENRTVKAFTGIDASRGLEVNITKGDAISVEVVADDNLHELIKTEVTGTVLKIYSDKNIGKAKSKVINVTVTELNELDASSGSKVVVNGTIESPEFDIDLSSGANISIDLASSKVSCDASSGAYINLSGQLGAFEAETSSGANMKIKEVTTTKAELDASSGANIKISGSGESLSANASSGAVIHAEDFVVKKGSVDVSSAGTVKVNASEELSAEAGSGSSVFYKGEPSITHQDISKSGTLKKM